MSLEPGLKGSAETVVVHENTAAAVGSGALEVFATPSMIGLMEKAAMDAVMPYLAEGESTVGTEIRLSFRVVARSGEEIIGQGTHTRFIVSQERFMQKVEAKKQQQ